jgi:hypothetical protein
VKPLTLVVALPLMLAAGVAAHAVCAGALKAVLWSWSPLASGEPEAATYERRVYHTADPAMTQVMAVALASGLLVWLALVLPKGGRWCVLAGFAALAAAVALDLKRWERVAASASHLWFQRGFGTKVHQLPIEGIHDVAVEEIETGGFTLRHGRHNQLVRLAVRTEDRRIVALPKTDARRGLDPVEAMANHVRLRLEQLGRRQSLQASSEEASRAAREAATEAPREDDLKVALKRLRQQAAAPDLPRAVPLKAKRPAR